MFRLVYEMNGRPRVIDLPDGTHIVGRSRTCDVVIPNKSVSGQHVRIDVEGNSIRFRDLLSRNGTKVNGSKSEAGTLQPGDEIKLGQVILRLESDIGESASADPLSETPPAAAVAAAPAPAPEPAVLDEETPVDQNFLPATVPARPESRAVQVVKPAAARPAATGRAVDRRKVLYAAGGFIAVILLALLFVPTPSRPPRTRRPRFSYWRTVHEGIDAFKRGDYAGAAAAWNKAEDGRRRYIPASKNTAALTLARIARPFALAKQGKRIGEVNWEEKIQAIHDLVDGSDLRYKEDKDFAAGPLMDACMREQAAQRVRRQADRLFEAGEYEAAKEQYAAIPRASIYHAGVDERIIACDRERVRRLRRKAFSLYRSGDVRGAIAELEKLDPAKRTDEDNRNIAKWRTDLEVRALMQEFKRLVASGNAQNWVRAKDVYARLLQHRDHPAVIDLKGLKEQLDRKLYVRNVQNWYRQWTPASIASLLKAKNNPLASDPAAQALINKAIAIQQEFAAARKCIRDQDDLEGIEKAISHWNMVRRLESDPTHPANSKAQQLTAQWPPEKRGEICKRRADEAFRRKEYRKARQYWETAKDKYGTDVTAEIEMIRKFGNRLFNRGNAERIRKNYGQARVLYKQALDCYLPTEPMYQKILKTMELYHLDD